MTTPRRSTKAAPASPSRKPRAAAAPPPASEPATAGLAPRPLVLHFLRHADAGDASAWTGDDAERPLTKKGRKHARRLGRHLADLGQAVDAIWTSPRVRAADTARLVGKALGVRPSVEERLGGGFDFDDLRSLAGGVGAAVADLMLVGHDPDLSELVSLLVGAHVGLVKGSLATIELEGRDPAPGRGTLRWLLPPEAIRG
jgi:phosphohistidine phosphatase